jgi:hypothetical protein
MNTDQIISKELPSKLQEAAHYSAIVLNSRPPLLKEFQQAQLDAINRFVAAVEKEAKKRFDTYKFGQYGNALSFSITELRKQLNEQAK